MCQHFVLLGFEWSPSGGSPLCFTIKKKKKEKKATSKFGYSNNSCISDAASPPESKPENLHLAKIHGKIFTVCKLNPLYLYLRQPLCKFKIELLQYDILARIFIFRFFVGEKTPILVHRLRQVEVT